MKRDRKKGQSMIEFTFVSVIFISMLSLSFNAILAFCTQQYISYAVFMSARAYQAAGARPADQSSAALETLKGYLPGVTAPGDSLNIDFKFPGIRKTLAKIRSVSVPTPAPNDYGPADITKRVRVEFDVPFVEINFVPGAKAKLATVALSAESFLGREVTREECQDFFQKFISSFTISDPKVQTKYKQFADKYAGNMEDNGC